MHVDVEDTEGTSENKSTMSDKNGSISKTQKSSFLISLQQQENTPSEKYQSTHQSPFDEGHFDVSNIEDIKVEEFDESSRGKCLFIFKRITEQKFVVCRQ